MKHTTIGNYGSYDAAFDAAAAIVRTRRKNSWRGRVRIKYRRSTDTFDVQVPAP